MRTRSNRGESEWFGSAAVVLYQLANDRVRPIRLDTNRSNEERIVAVSGHNAVPRREGPIRLKPCCERVSPKLTTKCRFKTRAVLVAHRDHRPIDAVVQSVEINEVEPGRGDAGTQNSTDIRPAEGSKRLHYGVGSVGSADRAPIECQSVKLPVRSDHSSR